MEELVKQALDKYFSDFKEYHLLILIGFTVAIGLIQIVLSIWINRKIERFKNDLKKSEIKFSRYNQLQIESLSKVYQLLATFLESTKIVENNLSASSPENTAKITKNWLRIYSKVYSTFLREKYILPIKIKDKFDSIISQLNNASGYIKKENEISSMYYTYENGEVEFMGDYLDRNEIYSQLKKYNKDGVIRSAVENIKELQKEIEIYFEKIE